MYGTDALASAKSEDESHCFQGRGERVYGTDALASVESEDKR